MTLIQAQGVHHITLMGADRQTSIDFWEGVLGMPFVFEQPNLDDASENHLYFDPGDGRLITIFCNEDRKADRTRDVHRCWLRASHRFQCVAGKLSSSHSTAGRGRNRS